MTTGTMTTPANTLLPSLSTLRNLAIGGAAGLVLWEVFARVITKAVLGYPLEPAGLIDAIFQNQLGLSVNIWLREAMHYGVGILGYPVAYFLISRLIPAWGKVLDAVILIGFTLAVAVHSSRNGVSLPLIGFWLAVAALSTQRFWRGSSAVVDALTWGNFTWLNALAIMAPLGGLSFFLLGEGGDLSFMSFLGHVIYGAIAVLVFHRLEARVS